MDMIDYDWQLAEKDVATWVSPYECPDCKRPLQTGPHSWQGSWEYCSTHRCAASVRSGYRAGERCRNQLAGTNPAYCAKHGCQGGWVLGDELVYCADEGSIRPMPDGSQRRVCDLHYRIFWSGQPGPRH